MQLRKPYIVIFTGYNSNITDFVENEDLWDVDNKEEFYGYYRCEIDGWKILKQSLYVIDTNSDDNKEFEKYIKMAKRVFERCKKFEPTVILASTNLAVWKSCFDKVFVIEDRYYEMSEWENIIRECIKLYKG
jgi:hypothetical protein